MNRIKIFLLTKETYITNWIENKVIVDNLDDADLVLFSGGEDVHASLYGEVANKYLKTNFKRDLKESKVFIEAKKRKIKTAGICRGSQLLCALSGGKIIQHQENPNYIHDVQTKQGVFKMTSTHHNAMNPYCLHPADYDILGWTKGLSKFHLNGKEEESYRQNEREVEICVFKNTDSLGIQPHPEFMYGKETFEKELAYFNELLNNFMNNKL